ncbi:LamG-like jellyroll fold domain-containing protein [Autumnicola musiva]|uniref:LamG-like jellyroll fold domain-containing protein n=1 Tax=Autumnicola musiva TaxID=3075589 RepID=A0ABU3D8H5_9FLAO|nr:LamG-like jellyroll fold domain-containing protein [Zunongwangia sp. F117]MDT0677832.1 LamG-like jellyroll fold domain-containing protein [Zunongwangia sp. F117]
MGKITPVVKAVGIPLFLIGFISFVLAASISNPPIDSYKSFEGVGTITPISKYNSEKPFTAFSGKSGAFANPVIEVDSKTNASCSDNPDGDINISISGGTPPYSYSWSGTGNFSSSSEDITNLSPGTYSIKVTDANNSSSSETINIEIEDNIQPSVSTKNITVQLDENGSATISAEDIDDGSTDNCQIEDLSLNKTNFDCNDVGSNSVELTVTDVNGNAAFETATVTVEDNIQPSVSTQNITIQLDANSSATISAEDIDDGSTDNCQIENLSLNKTNFDCDDVGANTVSLTVTDVNGNSASENATVTVEDNIQPSVKIQNITIQLDANGSATISAEDIDDGSTDNCQIEDLSLNKTNFDCNDVGNYSVELTVTDINGNAASETATVTVEDNIQPSVSTQNITIQLDENGSATISAEDIDDGSTDNCQIENLSLNKTYFICNDVGSNSVELTVTDVNGNSASETATVTIEDNIQPSVSTQNITIQLDENGSAIISAEDIDNGSTDNCQIENFSLNKTNFTCNDVGSNSVELTITDVNGNAASENATVTVEDNIDPEIPQLPDLTWSCSEEIVDFPTTTDNCDAEITGTTTDPLQFDTYGEYNITWTFTDSSENQVTAVQKIIIPEPTVNSVEDIVACNGETISTIAFGGSDVDGTIYNWTSSNTNIGIPAIGSNQITSFEAENISDKIITSTVTVTPVANNCEGENISFTITVNPTPSLATPEAIVVCDGEQIDGANFSGIAVTGTTISWSNDNTNTGLAASGNGDIPSFTATNTTDESIFSTISVTPSANGCEGIVETFTIEVKPNPTVTAPETQVYCNGITADAISLTGSPAGVSYNIEGGAAIGLSNRSSASEIPSFTPVNNSSSPVTAEITITPKANGCTGDPVSYKIKVNPTPNVSISPSGQQLCSGETTGLSLSGGIQGTTFNWTVSEILPSGSVSGAEDGNGSKIAQTLTNNTNNPATVKYRVIPTANECSGTPIIVTVTVNPIPEFEVNIPECVATVNLNDPNIKSNNNLTYTYWTNSKATNAVRNPSAVGVGTYFIKGTSAAGCSVIKEVIIDKIQPVITNLNDAPVEICSGEAFNYLPESNLEGTIISWSRAAVGENTATNSSDRNNVNPNESLVNETGAPITATYTFTLEKNDCTNEIAVNVEVSPAPQLIQESIDDICNGSSINYTPKSSLSNSTITWRRNAFEGNSASSGSGTIDEILYNETGVEIGVTYFITITSAKGCSVEENISFSLLSGPKVTATASKNIICAGETVDLSSTFEGEQQSIKPVLFEENLNGSSGNWITINNSNGGNSSAPRWRLRPNNYTPNYSDNIRSNDGSQFFLSSSDAQGQNTYTETILQYNKGINTIGYNSLELSFWQYYRHYNSIGEVEVSTDNDNWERVYSTPSRNNKGLVSFDLDGWTGNENLYIRFRYRAYWGYWWAIDNIKLTGEGSIIPDVTWTSSTNPEWSSNEPNPTNLSVSRTTTFTATYTDPDIECPGVGTVEVEVKDPLQPEIIANYCSLSQTNQVLLSVNDSYDSYRWVASGQTISSDESLQVSLAQTYTLYVTRDGCEASTSITPNENLIINGDFEQGNTNDFNTAYRYVSNNPNRRDEMWPEGTYTVGEDAYDYHSNFQGRGHGGRGNYMIVNGDRSIGNVVWQSNTLDIIPNTDYYFSAWTANVNPASPARLRIQVFIPGSNTPVVESTLGDLTNEPVGNWINFYNPELWNSGNNTRAIVRIINENPIAGGNDFGIDDISFAAFRSFDFEFTPENNGPLCEGDQIQLFSNLEGGREPITFEWSGPNGFTSSEENPVIENASLTNAGTYSLKISDFYGCDIAAKTTTVEIPGINAGEDIVICAEAARIDGAALSGTISNLINLPATGAWSGGSGNFIPNRNDLNAIYFPTNQEIETGAVILELQSDNSDISCTDEIILTLNPTPVINNISVATPSCFSGSDGTATVNVSGGTAPYTYVWSDGQTEQTATGLSKLEDSDAFFVTVTDANGCSATSENIVIDEPTPLEIISTSFTAVSCFGGKDGTAIIEVAGGFLNGAVPGYNFQLLNSEGTVVYTEEGIETNNITIPELIAGNYTFVVNTAANCTSLTSNINITQPPEIIVDAGELDIPQLCGITSLQLNALPVDVNLGSGTWSILSGEGGSFNEASLPDAIFSGESNEIYELQWTVTPETGCEEIADVITVELPQACSKLDFDGEDDYVDFGNSNNFGESAFTLEAWIKPSSLKSTRTIISKRDPENQSIGYDLILKNGSPSFSVGNKSAVSSFRLSTNRWFHIAGVYTPGSEIKLYVDGVLIKTNTNGIPSETGNITKPFLIGASPASGNIPGTKDYFHGWIEEVRVWNKDISEDQVRFMMNQRLEKSGNNGVRGSVLRDKVAIPGALSWNHLSGYYQLLADPEVFINGQTPDLSRNAVHGELKNIQTWQQNTAPLPYISNNNGEWYAATTWLHSDVWEPPNSLGIDNKTKIDWNIVKMAHNVDNPATTNNKNSITLLGLISESGKLKMIGAHGVSANGNGIPTGNSLNITHYLRLDGNIDLNGESQLIQAEGSILDQDSKGYIQKDQQGTKNSYNYNYWSSTVSITGNKNNSGFTIASVLRDGSDIDSPRDITFGSPHTFADGNYSGNLRISSYWLNIFHGTSDVYGEWRSIGPTTNLSPGTGYTMKGPSGTASISDFQNYVFQGKPHNGTINIKISDYENRLIGNPYPSALNAKEFILDNLQDVNGGRNSKNIFNGTLYFWDHFGQENTHVLAEYVGGYAAYNLSGGVPGVSNDRRINNSGNRGGSKKPKSGIPAAQGFFVNTALDETVSKDITVEGGNIVFKNSQRMYGRENPGNGNSQFLRPLQPTKNEKISETDDKRSKIRVDFKSPTGYYRQILVTADDFATNNFDLGYDAPMIDYNVEDMFWTINESEFVIQGVANFAPKQVLPLGLVISEENEFEISIASLENLPADFQIYLRDNETNTYYDLSEVFKATLAPGYYTTRYDIVFTKEEPVQKPDEEPEEPIEEPVENETKYKNLHVSYAHGARELNIQNPELVNISEVVIFDITGKRVQTFEEVPNEKEFNLPVNRFSPAIYVVKVITDDKTLSRKIIIR